MAISGSLRTMQFSELLQWLSTGLKTGTLVIQGGPGEKRIYFQNGKIVSSSSTVEREFLGRFLVGFGFISEEELVRALEVQQESKVLLGKILVMIGAIREEELADLLRLKAAETIYDVFLWEDGSFAFLDGEIPNLTMVTISSDVTGIVMEGLRRFDEWQRIRTRVTSLRQIPAVLIPVEEGLNDREKMILGAIDGHRSIERIAAATHNPDFHVAKFVYDLLESGHLQLVGEGEEERLHPERHAAELQSEILSAVQSATVYRHLPASPDLAGAGGEPSAAPEPVTEFEFAAEPAPSVPPQAAARSAAPISLPPLSLEDAIEAFVGGGAPRVVLEPPPSPTPPPHDFARFLKRDDTGSGARRSATPPPAHPAAPPPGPAPAADADLPEAVEAGDSIPGAPAVVRKAPEGPPPAIRLSAVPRLKKPMEELMSFSFTPDEAFIVSRINGIWDVRSIARISPFPEAEVLRLFGKLEAGGFIAFK